MVFIKKLSIAHKIYLIPLVGIIGLITYLLITITEVNGTVSTLRDAQTKQFPLLQLAEKNLIRLEKIKETLGAAVASAEEDMLDAASELANDLRSDLDQIRQIDKTTANNVEAIRKEFNVYFQSSYSLSKEMLDETVDFSTVGARSQAMSSQLADVESSLKQFQQQQMKAFTAAFEGAETSASSLSIIGIVVAILTVGALLAVAIPVSLTISNSLKDVINSMKNIASEDGDLTIRLSTKSQDEVGDLVHWFNSFVEKLQNVIKQIVDASLPLAEQAGSVNRLSSDIHEIMQRQIQNAQQSKMSVDEMSASVASIAQNAAEAASAAKLADSEAQKGFAVVDSTVNSIQSLSENMQTAASVVTQLQEDTNKVNVVLEVIRGIAEQTNLLALNAAIEAARAGEQGRGFAVVADEVRSLASRTQESTEEINAMLEQLQSAASAAVETMDTSKSSVISTVDEANQAGSSLQKITETVNSINAMNEQIAVATEEQQTVSHLMVGHVNDIQTQTDETAASSTQLAGVAENLNQLASSLEQIARSFRV